MHHLPAPSAPCMCRLTASSARNAAMQSSESIQVMAFCWCYSCSKHPSPLPVEWSGAACRHVVVVSMRLLMANRPDQAANPALVSCCPHLSTCPVQAIPCCALHRRSVRYSRHCVSGRWRSCVASVCCPAVRGGLMLSLLSRLSLREDRSTTSYCAGYRGLQLHHQCWLKGSSVRRCALQHLASRELSPQASLDQARCPCSSS